MDNEFLGNFGRRGRRWSREKGASGGAVLCPVVRPRSGPDWSGGRGAGLILTGCVSWLIPLCFVLA